MKLTRLHLLATLLLSLPPGGTARANGQACTADTGCTADERCILWEGGTRTCCDGACQASMTTGDEIRNEALKPSNAALRPLPMASMWCSGPAAQAVRDLKQSYGSSGGAADLAYQLGLIDQGHHVLPVVDTYLPSNTGPSDPTDWTWGLGGTWQGQSCGPACEAARFDTYMQGPINELKDRYLPMTVMTPQPEMMLSHIWRTPDWPGDALDDLHCPNIPNVLGEFDGCYLTPFADEAHYQNVGWELARKNQVQKYQQWYPNPPMVMIVDNNEADRDWNWLDALDDPRASQKLQNVPVPSYSGVVPGVHDPNAALKAELDGLWVNLYRKMQTGFKNGLSPGWQAARPFWVAYHSRPMSFEDSYDNSIFKPDLNTYLPCTAKQVADGLCYRQVWPRSQCTSSDASIAGCFKVAFPRASLPWQVVIANLFPSMYYLSAADPSYDAKVAQMRRAYHFADDSWPRPEGDNIDKIYRMFDGSSFTGGVKGDEKYMTGAFLTRMGFSSLLLDERIQTFRAGFWAETYSVTASDLDKPIGALLNAPGGGPAAVFADSRYAHLTTARARGVTQLTLWMNRPRVVRNFDVCYGGGGYLDYAQRFVDADLQAVDAVWTDPVLKEFWQSSSLVENTAYTPLFRARAVLPFQQNANGAPSKYWFLTTSAESPEFQSWKTSTDQDYGIKSDTVQTEVVAIARKKGSRYLVYAFTQLPTTQERVTITVPGTSFGTLTVDVPQGGAFFLVDDAAASAAPVIQVLNPGSVYAGAGATIVTLTGTGFRPQSIVKLDGQTLTGVSYVSSSQLRVLVPASALKPGYRALTVENPAGLGGAGAPVTFTVHVSSCFDAYARGATANGDYSIDPDLGGSVAPFRAYCDVVNGGWTLIAAQPTLVGDNFTSAYAQTPRPGQLGALAYYMTTDLRQPGMELRVKNVDGDTHTFKAGELSGPLRFDGPNVYDAAHSAKTGVVFGNAWPVINHYQLGFSCGGPECRGAATSDPSGAYSGGLLIVFDWDDGVEQGASPLKHAHFGGTQTLENNYARRGTELWVRARNRSSAGVAQSCLAHRNAGQTLDAMYLVDPDLAGPTVPFLVWCDMTTSGGGWTLILSQEQLFVGNMFAYLDSDTPFPGINGVRGYYMTHDLKAPGVATQIRVANVAGQTTTFNVADFGDKLILADADGLNRANPADATWRGILHGKNFPVVNHYQLGQLCTSASEVKTTGAYDLFSNGFAVVFDWDPGEGGPTNNNHAHFGGTAAIEGGWSHRGSVLYIR